MPTVRFLSASPAVGADVFTDTAIKPYTKGRSWRKIAWIVCVDGTIGTGKFDLYYGANKIFSGLQSTSTDAFPLPFYDDCQTVVDKRWCSPQEEISLITTEAPGATLTFIVGIVERLGGVK